MRWVIRLRMAASFLAVRLPSRNVGLGHFEQHVAGGEEMQDHRVGIIVNPAMNAVVEQVDPLDLGPPNMQWIFFCHHSNPEIMAA